MANKLIVLSGKQFSGKDTAAQMLLDILSDFRRIGIGDAIKIEYGRRNGLTFDEVEKNKSFHRPNLIVLGNEGRAIDPLYWLKKIIEEDGNIIVPDLRLKKELEIFKNSGAITIRVEADRENRAKRGVLVTEDDLTETDLDDVTDWDYVIENNAGLEELRAAVQELVKKLSK